jgi:DNA helicase II / ATP-dependent DNA helicase PcrA
MMGWVGNTLREDDVVLVWAGSGGVGAMGIKIAKNIKEAIQAGTSPQDIAVLVRLYAETGVIEYGLIEQGIPYEIVGNVPFYDRPENKLLVKYLLVAQIERRMQERDGKLAADELAQLTEVWWDVLRTPKRYLSREQSESILREVLTRATPPSAALLMASGRASPAVRNGLVQLAKTIA